MSEDGVKFLQLEAESLGVVVIGGTCSGCKWWELKQDHEWWGNCKRQYISDHRINSCFGEVDTRDDFGCVQWEAKP